LNLAEKECFVLAQKIKLVDAGDGVRQELMGRIELAASYNVPVDVPAYALGSANTFGILFGLDGNGGRHSISLLRVSVRRVSNRVSCRLQLWGALGATTMPARPDEL